MVAERFFSTERTAALEEIAEKYMADFPQTRIEIVTVESGEEAMGMLQSGEADLVELSEQEQPAAVEQGLLTELSPYLDVWEERSTLTAAAKQAVASMGADFAYLLPATLNQDLVYYRSDWFEEFNQGKEEGLVYCRIWEDFADAQQKLQDKGAAGLVFGGKDRLVDLFDSILWSAVSLGRMEDPAASYLSAVDENDTLFTLEQAATAAEQFSALIRDAVPQEALDWTEDQAIEAFTSGQAIALLAGQDRLEDIAGAMEEGTWGVAAYPRGTTGTAITSLEFTGFGVAASAENVGNAVHFLTYLSNGDNNTHLAKACGTVPIHTTAADGPVCEPADGPPGRLVLLCPGAADVPRPRGLAGDGQSGPAGVSCRGDDPAGTSGLVRRVLEPGPGRRGGAVAGARGDRTVTLGPGTPGPFRTLRDRCEIKPL